MICVVKSTVQFSFVSNFLAKERVVGWYHTGPALYPSDIRIHTSIISK